MNTLLRLFFSLSFSPPRTEPFVAVTGRVLGRLVCVVDSAVVRRWRCWISHNDGTDVHFSGCPGWPPSCGLRPNAMYKKKHTQSTEEQDDTSPCALLNRCKEPSSSALLLLLLVGCSRFPGAFGNGFDILMNFYAACLCYRHGSVPLDRTKTLTRRKVLSVRF